MRFALRLLAGVALLGGLTPAPTSAQVVRGVVREAGSGRPLAGVVVSATAQGADEGRGAAVARDLSRTTLTGADGSYAVRVTAETPFIISAKRIGAQRFTSPPITLTAGESRRVDIALSPIGVELPIVAVSGVSSCRARDDQGGRVASLWDEARTALTASEVALRDRLFRATITQYERTLAPVTLRIEDESRRVRTGVTEHAFVSVPAETLATIGYATDAVDGRYEVYAPDERILLSEHFVRDHCFRLAPPRGDTLVGIAFEPVKGRKQRDIRGTIWLDARSLELRTVAFRYTDLPIPVPPGDTLAGGEVRFARLANGAWYVTSWFIRTPLVEASRQVSRQPIAPRRRTSEMETVVISIIGYRVQGGTVVAEDARRARALASLTGRVLDSTGGRPLAGATVRIAGTPSEVRTRADGSYRLDSLAGGEATLLVEHPDYAMLGLQAAEQALSIPAEGTTSTEVHALGTEQLIRALCRSEPPGNDTVVVRFVVTDSATGAALAERTLVVNWDDAKVVGPKMVRTQQLRSEPATDEAGGVTMCALPSQAQIVVELPDDGGRREWRVRAPRKGFAVIPLRR